MLRHGETRIPPQWHHRNLPFSARIIHLEFRFLWVHSQLIFINFLSQRANYSSIEWFLANSFSLQGSLLMLYVAKARKRGKWESAIELKLAWNNVSNPIVDDGSLFEKKKSHLSISAFFVSLCFLHICAHTKRQKTSEEKSRSDLKCLLVHSSIYAAKREENWSWRQKNTSSSIERERREKKMVRKNSEAFFLFLFMFCFCLCLLC